MKQTFIQSIHTVLAAGGECKIWHPNRGHLGKVTRVSEDFIQCRDYREDKIWDFPFINGCKILRHRAGHFFDSVDKGNFDWPYYKCELMIKPGTDIGKSVRLWLDEINLIEVNYQLNLRPNGDFAYNYWEIISMLLRAGYPASIPVQHWTGFGDLMSVRKF